MYVAWLFKQSFKAFSFYRIWNLLISQKTAKCKLQVSIQPSALHFSSYLAHFGRSLSGLCYILTFPWCIYFAHTLTYKNFSPWLIVLGPPLKTQLNLTRIDDNFNGFVDILVDFLLSPFVVLNMRFSISVEYKWVQRLK